jgi:hypothetical protein
VIPESFNRHFHEAGKCSSAASNVANSPVERLKTTRANHAVINPIFIQYIISVCKPGVTEPPSFSLRFCVATVVPPLSKIRHLIKASAGRGTVRIADPKSNSKVESSNELLAPSIYIKSRATNDVNGNHVPQ